MLVYLGDGLLLLDTLAFPVKRGERRRRVSPEMKPRGLKMEKASRWRLVTAGRLPHAVSD